MRRFVPRSKWMIRSVVAGSEATGYNNDRIKLTAYPLAITVEKINRLNLLQKSELVAGQLE